MFETGTIFIMGLGLSPIMLMAVALCFLPGPKRAPLAWRGSKPSRALFIPSAEETARSIERFREAAERSMMVDFIWDRYSRGRAIFLDDIRRAAAKREKRTGARSKTVLPKRL
jgi:hypothetical protein